MEMGHLNNLSKFIFGGKKSNPFWEFLAGKLGKEATYLDWEHLRKRVCLLGQKNP